MIDPNCVENVNRLRAMQEEVACFPERGMTPGAMRTFALLEIAKQLLMLNDNYVIYKELDNA